MDVGRLLLQAIVVAALEAAIMPLAQPRIRLRRKSVRGGDRRGGGAGAQQVAGVDRGDRFSREPLAHGLGFRDQRGHMKQRF